MSQIEERDESLNNWLESLSSSYRKRVKYSFKKFFKFLSSQGWQETSGDLILERHEQNRKSDDKRIKFYFDDLMPQFLKWLELGGLEKNSAVTTCRSVSGFFRYYREPLQVLNGKIKTVEKKKKWHTFSKDELVKMVQVGDLEEKAVLMLGIQLGIRVGDFVSLKRTPILEAYQDSNGEFPLEFEVETAKQSVISIGHISKDVYEILQLHWASQPESQYVFPSNARRLFISDQRANDVLKNCWLKAYPDRKNVKVRFHELRSYKISALTNLGVNTWAIMKMTGKKVSQDINTYLTGINLKELFMKGEQVLTLTQITTNNHTAIEELRKEVTKLKEEKAETLTRISSIEEKFNTLTATLEKLGHRG